MDYPGLPNSELAQSANQFMTGQAIAPYLANLPNYANMVGQRTQNTGSMLKGQLPQDVIQQIQQQAAERGIATGSPGSNNSNSAYLRALGLNSLQMQQQGSQELSRGIADTPVPQLFNPMSLNVPTMLAQQGMGAAAAGLRAGGRGAPSVTMPGFGGAGMRFSPDAASMNGPALSGPSWGTGGGQPSSDGGYAAWAKSYGPQLYSGGSMQNGMYRGTGMNDFDPNAYTYAQGGQYGGSVDWSNLALNTPAGWSEDNNLGDFGGVFNQIDASNPDNAFMFE